jgi:chaperone required for assembly of F1-ATPase
MLRTAKRFYKTVAIGHIAGGFGVLLSGKPIRTPDGTVLALPTAALAAALANEWLSQGETLKPETMLLTRLAATAVDRIAPNRAATVDALIAYAASDLLCYRAESPADLVSLQDRCWQPLLDWVAERWGARMAVGAGVLPIAQPPAVIETLRRVVEVASDIELTALSCAVQASGSLIIGLALLHHRMNPQSAFAAAVLDEQYQADRWGSDAEAVRRREEIAKDLRAAASFLALTRSGGEDEAGATLSASEHRVREDHEQFG